MTIEYVLVNEPIFLQILALVALLGGIAVIITGVRMTRRRTPSIWQEAQWLRLIRRMARGEDSHVYGADDLQAMWRQWFRQQGTAAIGGGAGILVGTLVSFALAQLALHAPFSLPYQLIYVCFAPPAWGMILGFTCGGLVGTRQRATAGRHDAAVADTLVSHQVLDYRSPLLTLLVAIPAIVYTPLTILLAPKYSAFDAFDLHMYFVLHGHELVSPPHWILAIYPGAMWLTVLLVECCAWVRVKSVASITSPDAGLARRASLALTTLNVGFIYAPMVIVPVMMGSIMAQLLWQPADALGLDTLVNWTFVSTMIVGWASYIAVLLFAVEGRLGGRLTGWPWSKGSAQDDGAAAEG